MAFSKKLTCLVTIFSVGTLSLVRAQTATRNSLDESCRSFVQEFYRWYVPLAAKDNDKTAPWVYALKSRRFAFSHELSSLLSEDSGEPEIINGEVVEVETGPDPFVHTQDVGAPPGEPHVVGRTTHKDGSYWVEVYRIHAGKKDEKPIVLPELRFKRGQWVFVNFHYPEGGDLLSQLKKNHEERLRLSKKQTK